MDLSSLPAMAVVQQVLQSLQPEDTTNVDVLQTGGQRGDAVRDGARQFIRAEIQGPEERQHCTPT